MQDYLDIVNIKVSSMVSSGGNQYIFFIGLLVINSIEKELDCEPI